jgi:hypothetical protein
MENGAGRTRNVPLVQETTTDPQSDRRSPSSPGDLKLEPAGEGLAKLVLSIIELLRELLERQAIRRMESGSLTEEQIEKLGSAFMHLSERMEKIKKEFGLSDDDLNIDLGPLGKLR